MDGGEYVGRFPTDGGAQLWREERPGDRSHRVRVVHDASAHGVAWGYSGSGPHDCALSILTDLVGDGGWAAEHAAEFMNEVVAAQPLAGTLRIPVTQVDQWVRSRCVSLGHGSAAEAPSRQGEPTPRSSVATEEVRHASSAAATSAARQDGVVSLADVLAEGRLRLEARLVVLAARGVRAEVEELQPVVEQMGTSAGGPAGPGASVGDALERCRADFDKVSVAVEQLGNGDLAERARLEAERQLAGAGRGLGLLAVAAQRHGLKPEVVRAADRVVTEEPAPSDGRQTEGATVRQWWASGHSRKAADCTVPVDDGVHRLRLDWAMRHDARTDPSMHRAGRATVEGRLVGLLESRDAGVVAAAPVRAQLRTLMDETGDSAKVTAQGLGVAEAWLAEIADGRRTTLSVDEVQLVCESLHCTPADLLGPADANAIVNQYPQERWPEFVEPLPPPVVAPQVEGGRAQLPGMEAAARGVVAPPGFDLGA